MEWNFTYENQGTSAFLVFRLRDMDELDTMGIGMISNNHIPHILPISFTQIDENRYLRYSISSKIPLENFFSGMVSKKRLLNVFIGICETIEAGSEYMLESDMIVLDKRYIFANVTTGEPDLVYLPLLNRNEPLELGRFFKEIMFSTQFDATEDCGYVAAIINHLNTNVNFSLKAFKTLLYTLRNQGGVNEQQITKSPVQREAVRQPLPTVQKSVQVPQEQVQKPTNKVPARPVISSVAGGAVLPPKPPVKVPNQPVKSMRVQVPPQVSPTLKQGKETSKEDKRKFSLFGGKSEKKAFNDTGKAKKPEFAVPGMESKIPVSDVLKTEKKEETAVKKKLEFGNQEVNGFTKVEAQPLDWVKPNEVSYGQTTILSSNAGQTTVLSEQIPPNEIQMEPPVPRPVLVRTKNGQRISVDKILFRIGTEHSFVDLWISDNSAVSRSHADIINHEGSFFVRDNNSTNHTYLNGILLVSNQEYPLADEDQVVLGNESFRFELK